MQVNNADGITSGGNQFKVNEHGVILGNVGTGGSVDVSRCQLALTLILILICLCSCRSIVESCSLVLTITGTSSGMPVLHASSWLME